MTAIQDVRRTADPGAFATPKRAAAAIVYSVAYLALLITTYLLTRETGAVLFLSAVGGVTAAFGLKQKTATGRVATGIFAIALLARSFSALAFHAAAVANNDPFRGSPDAWSYYSWASSLAVDFRHGWFPAISGYYEAGRWDVGYHYLLGAVYAVFGNSLVIGRLLGALFGALAVLLVLLIGRRFAAERIAVGTALVYALWPMSIGWATETILRDAFVWFLILAATLAAVRFAEAPSFAGWATLFVVITVLRYTRPYAAYLIYVGLGVALGLSIASRSLRPRIAGRAVPYVALLIAGELFFMSFGFPNAVRSVRAYNLPRWVEHPMPTKTVFLPTLRDVARNNAPPGTSPNIILPPIPRPDLASGEQDSVTGKASLPGNAVRLVLAPFGWTFYLPGHSIWPVYSVWPWYLLVPAGAIGAIVLLRRGPLLARVIVIVTAMYMAALAVVGRGDAIRQRETAVPFILLIAFAGIAAIRNRRRILAPAYAAWIVLLATAVVYHVHSLRGRRFSPEGIPLPPARSAPASPPATAAR